MKNLYIYRVYETGKGGKYCGAAYLSEMIRKTIEDVAFVTSYGRRSPSGEDESYVLVGYELDKPLDAKSGVEHFRAVTEAIGNMSDKIGYELAIEIMAPVANTIVTPDSLIKKGVAKCASCDKCPDGCADCDEESEEDSWAEVRRLRDLTTKKEKGAK